jgi:hypothetical protein
MRQVMWGLALAAASCALPATAHADPNDACRSAYRITYTVGRNHYSTPQTDINIILNACPQLASHMIWQEGYYSHYVWSPSAFAWANWNITQTSRLRQIYQALLRGDANLGLDCPDPTIAQQQPVDPNRAKEIYFSQNEAFDVYAAQLANAIYLEVTGSVPWSLLDYSPTELDILFNSTSLLQPIRPSQQTYYPSYITVGTDFQETARDSNSPHYLCDPREGYRFVSGANSTSGHSLIASTPLATLVKLSSWVSLNVAHGDLQDPHRLQQNGWGWTLRDRLQPFTLKGWKQAVAPQGCQSSSPLLAELARGVNIPLLVVGSQTSPDTSGNYLNRTHGGLVFGPGTPNERILWHTDELYAFVGWEEPWFPIQANGTAMPSLYDPLAEQARFDAVWRTPSDLSSWGFALQSGLPHVYPGAGFGVNDAGVYENRYDYGAFDGYWKLASTDPSTTLSSTLSTVYQYERMYQLCGWHLVNYYCTESENTFVSWVNGETSGGLSLPELPVHRTAYDYYARMQSCVNAYGGCANVQALANDWSNHYGSNLWRN